MLTCDHLPDSFDIKCENLWKGRNAFPRHAAWRHCLSSATTTRLTQPMHPHASRARMQPGDITFKCNCATLDPAHASPCNPMRPHASCACTQPGDIAFKCNYATLDPATGVVTKRRADRNFEHLGPSLCAAIDGLRLPSFPEHTVMVRCSVWGRLRHGG